MGSVIFIQIRKCSSENPTELTQVKAIEDYGLEGDHYNKVGGSRQVTIIQQEHLDEASSELKFQVNASATRRNLVTSDISLNSIPDDSLIRIGDIIVQKTGDCPPCEKMNKNLGMGGRAALEGKGGITAKIIKGGLIKKGCIVQLIN